MCCCHCVFFFKQKTAYEMRISDWSSDVCSSDLFPNDLLLELDRMEFFVYETGERVKAKVRPIVIITSNNEQELPDAFLRRCFFHFIKFPDKETMQDIVDVHFPGLKTELVKEREEERHVGKECVSPCR